MKVSRSLPRKLVFVSFMAMVAACAKSPSISETCPGPTPGDGGSGGSSCTGYAHDICDGACVDTLFSEEHCGGCYLACDVQFADVCYAGECRCNYQDACWGPSVCCPDVGCRDLETSPTNCGACGVKCGFGEECQSGQCVAPPSVAPCAHGPCNTGVELVAACDPCVAKVCDADAFCCSMTWDAMCVQEVGTLCGLACP